MIRIDIPGWKELRVEHMVLDFNGTMAVDGNIVAGVAERLNTLAENLTVHILTADTFGKVQQGVAEIRCELSVLAKDGQDRAKRDYVRKLGAPACVCLGNGRNDRFMLGEAALGIAVIMEEGVSVETLTAADIVIAGINPALDLFKEPRRLIATLRS